MNQFTQFNIKKQEALDALGQLNEILKTLGELGVDVDQDLKKIQAVFETIHSDIMRIALLGAFSDGKTSVIAAWLGKVMADMKIAIEESSDHLAIYRPEGLPERCEIIDTPGLFGDKTHEIEGRQEMYADQTKKFISEAHLIFYVVDAVNPLKDSHSDIVRWVLRDLHKLSSTIFIINKMDEVTDLTEQAQFERQAEIKKENLTSKLERMAGLTPDEMKALNIVCISANPQGRGLDFWFGKPENFANRSRINDLKAIANNVLGASVPEVLIAKTGLDVLLESIKANCDKIQGQLDAMASFSQQRNEDFKRIQCDINNGQKDLKTNVRGLVERLDVMEKRLLGTLRSLEMGDIKAFLEDEIGYAPDGGDNKPEIGYKLYAKIKMNYDEVSENAVKMTNRISRSIGQQLDSSEDLTQAMMSKFGKDALGSLKHIKVSKEMILAGRDMLNKIPALAIKFKPWGAAKLAGNITKWAGPIGAAMTVLLSIGEVVQSKRRAEELAEIKTILAEMIREVFKEFGFELTQLSDDGLIEKFAPSLVMMKKQVAEWEQQEAQISAVRPKLEDVKKCLKSLGDKWITVYQRT